MILGDVKEENTVMDSHAMELKQFMRFDQGITIEDVLTEQKLNRLFLDLHYYRYPLTLLNIQYIYHYKDYR